MKKTLLVNYSLLILLIVITALISNITTISVLSIGLIMGLSVIKFILVSFQFMELRKAHSFWKVSVLSVVLLIVVVNFLIRISSKV